MNRFWLAAIALFAFSAKAQNINFPDIPHIHTALNHLTVIDLGEPIQLIAVADPDTFQIERAGDKVLLQPLKDGSSTNLILWTASRQVAYEIDVPDDVAKMNVLVRNLPQSVRAAANTPTMKERQEIAVAATTRAILGAQDIVCEPLTKGHESDVSVKIVRSLRTTEGIYLQYQILNHSVSPFRVTIPAVTHLQPTQLPISLLALRNHQISPQTLRSFKAKPDGTNDVASGQSQQTDVAPGGTTFGYVLVRISNGSSPEIYQLNFGSTVVGAIVEAVVL